MRLETIRQNLNRRCPLDFGSTTTLLPLRHKLARETQPAQWDEDGPPIDETCRSMAICEDCGSHVEIRGDHRGELPFYCPHCHEERMHTCSFERKIGEATAAA